MRIHINKLNDSVAIVIDKSEPSKTGEALYKVTRKAASHTVGGVGYAAGITMGLAARGKAKIKAARTK